MKTSPRHKRKPVPDNIIRTRWKESLTYCGPYPERQKRFYTIETLTGALERMIATSDRFLHATLQASAGEAPLSSIEGDLIYEDKVRLVYALDISSRARKRTTLRLCVAKNHEECSSALCTEFEAMEALHKRVPTLVVKPQRAGLVFLPDRHRRKEVNREVFAYITASLPGGGPLYVASNNQLGPRGTQPRRFSLADTDLVRVSLARLVAACYDAHSGTGLDPVDLSAPCLAWQKQPDGSTGAVLLQCPRLRRRVRPERLLQHLVFGVFQEGKHRLPLAPTRPDQLVAALSAQRSIDTARDWCMRFIQKARHLDKTHEEGLPGAAYLEMLEKHAQEL